ncbi:hypothetical protein [Corallococcus macrosporus]|uniref:Outer membrane protein beta-barrel domain-containing protein n=1 Tax=Myxococcus fulvus (strain ATCC BAA-855 / HW-1) TaxID=483219 RepID=F8CL48_MYXFH|nr:hypothetical protein [Corallococcus macrosporus]AEI65173.1 hypothetical protein LILAB_16350 [Corallococcus macrosporus]
MFMRLMTSAVLFSLLLPGLARAEAPTSQEWGLLLAGGGGLFAGNNSNNRGGLLSAQVLVLTRFNVEFGFVLQWGRTFRTSQAADLDHWSPGDALARHPSSSFWGAAGEARYRFLRDRRVSPWVALRVGTSTSTKIDTDAFVPRLYSSTHLALAAGAGLDVRIAGPLGVTLGGYYQRCDINHEPYDSICTGAGPTLVLSPHLRF